MFETFSKTLRREIRRRMKRRPLVSTAADMHILRTLRGATRPRVSQFRQFSRVLNPLEKMIYHTALVLFFVSLFWLGSAVLRGYRVQVPTVGGSYTEGIVGSPQLINPLYASLNDVDQDLVRLMYSGLMRYDSEGRLVPDLATQFTVSDDKTVYTFTLRQDVLWHDGESFDAEDVIFTFESIQNEEVGSPLYMAFQGVTVEALDSFTIQFTLEEAFAPFLQSLTVGVLPEHVWFDVLPERFPLVQTNMQPIGTGPYMFSKLSKDSAGYLNEYILKRNEDYYRQAPYIETVTFAFYPMYDGDAGAIQDLRQQAIDGIHFIPSELRDKVERKHIAVHTLQLPQYTALFINQEREPALQDAAVREALEVAIDKERLLQEALGGEGQIVYGPLLPGFPGYTEDVEHASYSMSHANELLDEEWPIISAETFRELRMQELTDQLIEEKKNAYVPPEVSTSTVSSTEAIVVPDPPIITTSTVAGEVEQILSGEIDPSQVNYRQKDDMILELDLVTVDTKEYRDAAALIQSAWQEIGITVNVAYVSSKELTRTVLKDRSYDILLYGVLLGADPDQYPFWHSSQIEAPGLNLALYQNKDMDALLEQSRTEIDDEQLAQVYQDIQTTILTDRPAIFLYTPIYTYVQDTDLFGFDTSRIFIPADRLNGITHWYVKTKGVWKHTNDEQ